MRELVWTALGALALMALPLGGADVAAQSKRPTVALLDFDFGTVQQWWSGNWDIGKGIADLLVDELVNDGTYRVIERKRLDAILAEQNFSNSERADPSAATVAKLGKVLGVKYLIVGSITKFGLEQKKQGIGGGGFGHGGFGLGNIGREKGKANVAITARMVDVTSAEIMASAKGEGVSSRSGLLLGGGAGGGGGAGFGGISMTSSDYQDTILGEATETAVKQVAEKLVAAKSRLENPRTHDVAAPSGLPGVGGNLHHLGHHLSRDPGGHRRLRPRSWAAAMDHAAPCWLRSSTPGASGSQGLTPGATSRAGRVHARLRQRLRELGGAVHAQRPRRRPDCDRAVLPDGHRRTVPRREDSGRDGNPRADRRLHRHPRAALARPDVSRRGRPALSGRRLALQVACLGWRSNPPTRSGIVIPASRSWDNRRCR